MNVLAHAAVSYAIAAQLTNDPQLIAAAIFFGLLPDFDHIKHIPRALKTGRFGSAARSKYHELYGLTLAAIFSTATYYLKPRIAPLVFFPLLAHGLLDFLTRPTRPLVPVDETEVHLEVYPKSLRGLTIADSIVTVVMLIWLIS